MKRFRPLERTRSGGTIRSWVALITAMGVGCLPVSSVLASTHGGGDNHVSGGNLSGGHALGGGTSHFSVGHSYTRTTGGFTGSSNVAKTHFSSSQLAKDSSDLGRHVNPGSEARLYSRDASSRTVTRHVTTLNQHQSKAAIDHHESANRFTSASRDLTRTNRDNSRNTVNAGMARSNIVYNHSLTASSAQSWMNQRLNQISNRLVRIGQLS